MKVVLDRFRDAQGNVCGEEAFHTEIHPNNTHEHPDGKTGQISSMEIIKHYMKNPETMKGTGWDQPSSIAEHAGKTKLEILLSEIVKADDKEARAFLGV